MFNLHFSLPNLLFLTLLLHTSLLLDNHVNFTSHTNCFIEHCASFCVMFLSFLQGINIPLQPLSPEVQSSTSGEDLDLETDFIRSSINLTNHPYNISKSTPTQKERVFLSTVTTRTSSFSMNNYSGMSKTYFYTNTECVKTFHCSYTKKCHFCVSLFRHKNIFCFLSL